MDQVNFSGRVGMTSASVLFLLPAFYFASPWGYCWCVCLVVLCALFHVIWSANNYLTVSFGERGMNSEGFRIEVWTSCSQMLPLKLKLCYTDGHCRRPWVSSDKNHNNKKQPWQPMTSLSAKKKMPLPTICLHLLTFWMLVCPFMWFHFNANMLLSHLNVITSTI